MLQSNLSLLVVALGVYVCMQYGSLKSVAEDLHKVDGILSNG